MVQDVRQRHRQRQLWLGDKRFEVRYPKMAAV